MVLAVLAARMPRVWSGCLGVKECGSDGVEGEEADGRFECCVLSGLR